MAETLELLPTRRATAMVNMATDLVLLRAAPGTDTVWVRHYDWDGAAFTYGRTQREPRVRQLAAELRAAGAVGVRRPSGGGIVDHRDDWTYSLVIPPESTLYRAPPLHFYRMVHKALAEALTCFGVPAALHAVAPPGNRQPTACFAQPECFDLVRPGTTEKLAGAALRRSRDGLLLQGSVAGVDLRKQEADREDLAIAFTRQLAQCFQLPSQQTQFPELSAKSMDLARREIEKTFIQ